MIAGKYRIEGVLGKGGMGIVFAAQHELLFQRVAIKLLLAEAVGTPEAVSRFLHEARAAARIQSEHVARVMDVGITETGLPYMVIELLEGGDLAKILEERGRIPFMQAVDWVLEALEAIAQAHALGIVHRDLKPSNLYLARRQNGASIVKVLDFGISKSTTSFGPQSAALTSTQSMLGSPLYMSPEQLRSTKTVDARADIWALGVILHELLSGAVPFMGESLGELFVAILEQEPAPLRATAPDVPPQLEQVVRRCLLRNVQHRFANVAELAQALAPFASTQGAGSVARIVSTIVPSASHEMRALSPSASTMMPSHPGAQSSSAATPALSQGPTPSVHVTNTQTGQAFAATNRGAPAGSVKWIVLAAVPAALLVVGVLFAVAVLPKLRATSAAAPPLSATASAAPVVATIDPPRDTAAPTIASAVPSAAPSASSVASLSSAALKTPPVTSVGPKNSSPKPNATARPTYDPLAGGR